MSHGGAIVVHTGEKGRPLSRAKWNTGDEKLPSFMNQYKDQFESFEGESRSAPVELVDSRTGGYVSRYQPGKGMQRPKFKRYAPGTPEWEEFGGKEYFDEVLGFNWFIDTISFSENYKTIYFSVYAVGNKNKHLNCEFELKSFYKIIPESFFINKDFDGDFEDEDEDEDEVD